MKDHCYVCIYSAGAAGCSVMMAYLRHASTQYSMMTNTIPTHPPPARHYYSPPRRRSTSSFTGPLLDAACYARRRCASCCCCCWWWWWWRWCFIACGGGYFTFKRIKNKQGARRCSHLRLTQVYFRCLESIIHVLEQVLTLVCSSSSITVTITSTLITNNSTSNRTSTSRANISKCTRTGNAISSNHNNNNNNTYYYCYYHCNYYYYYYYYYYSSLLLLRVVKRVSQTQLLWP